MLFNSNVIMTKYSGIFKIGEKANKISNCIRLEVGDVDFSPLESIKDNVARAFDEGETHYPALSGNRFLIEKIIDLEREENGIELTEENIYVTTGGSFGMFISLLSCINVGDEIVIFEPTWSHFEEMVRIVGGKSIKIQLSETNNYHLSKNIFDDYDTTNWKLILFSSPNNPTGTIYSEDDIRILVEFANRNNILLLCDQEYEAFSFGTKVISLFDQYDKSITSKSFSKTLSVAGLRLGYIMGCREWIECAKKCGFYSSMYTSSVIQYGIGHMLEDKSRFVNNMVTTFKERLIGVDKIFRRKSKLKYQFPEGAVYMWLDCRAYHQDDNYVSDFLLRNAKVSTVPGSCFGKGFIRISLGKDKVELFEAANRIVTALEKIS